jgi:hypothetical protein
MSTIKVDTLQTRAGSTAAVTGAGFVATDQIRGNTSAASVTVVAEGGTNTTNLQQGLAKCWIDYTTASSFVVNDSFNVASITDQGAGDATINISTDMASANYSVTSSTLGGLTNGTKIFQNGAKAAGTYRQISTQADGTAGDIGSSYATIHGDLA